MHICAYLTFNITCIVTHVINVDACLKRNLRLAGFMLEDFKVHAGRHAGKQLAGTLPESISVSHFNFFLYINL